MINFRQRLRDRELRQADVAERLGVSEATVSKWFSHKQAVPVPMLLPLADMLGVDVALLLQALSAADAEPAKVA